MVKVRFLVSDIENPFRTINKNTIPFGALSCGAAAVFRVPQQAFKIYTERCGTIYHGTERREPELFLAATVQIEHDIRSPDR